jgi:hypothetical protein
MHSLGSPTQRASTVAWSERDLSCDLDTPTQRSRYDLMELLLIVRRAPMGLRETLPGYMVRSVIQAEQTVSLHCNVQQEKLHTIK